jgi:hypothetical protein
LAKKKPSWKVKGGRASKQYEVATVGFQRSVTSDLLSTSPESPVHGAAGPRLVVRANPLFFWEDEGGRPAGVRALGARHHVNHSQRRI